MQPYSKPTADSVLSIMGGKSRTCTVDSLAKLPGVQSDRQALDKISGLRLQLSAVFSTRLRVFAASAPLELQHCTPHAGNDSGSVEPRTDWPGSNCLKKGSLRA